MAKQTGLGDNLYVDGYNISGDVGSISEIGGGPAALVMTGIDKLGYERYGGKLDGRLSFNSFFNDATGQATNVLKSLPTGSVYAYYARGTTLGNAAASMLAKQINYDGTRGDDGSLTFATSMQADQYGIEWGKQLTAGVRTDTAATNGTGVDFTDVSTVLGWQAYLQVFSFTGTSCTVTLQDSADNASFANLTGGAFTAATGRTTERLAGASNATVRRYLRAITSGTFSSCAFAVMFVRNATAVSF